MILSNGLSLLGFYRVFERAVSVLGNVSLSLFLRHGPDEPEAVGTGFAGAADAGDPRGPDGGDGAVCRLRDLSHDGENYDAAVLAAGHCGFGLGATPTAIANMQAITDRFGPSHMAFLVVPMVGAFFIDIVNALVIKLYLLLPIFG